MSVNTKKYLAKKNNSAPTILDLNTRKKESVEQNNHKILTINSLNIFNPTSDTMIYQNVNGEMKELSILILEVLKNDDSVQSYFNKLLLILKTKFKHKIKFSKALVLSNSSIASNHPRSENNNDVKYYCEYLMFGKTKIFPSVSIEEIDGEQMMIVDLMDTIKKIKILIPKEVKLLDNMIFQTIKV